MIAVPARQLPIPTLKYLGSEEMPTFGSWNMMNKDQTMKKFVQPGESKKWTVLSIGQPEPIPDQSMKQGCEIIRKALSDAGLKTSELVFPVPGILGPVPAKVDEGGAFDNLITGAFSQFESQKIDLVLVVLPFKDTAVYSRVKFWGDVKFGTLYTATQYPSYIEID